MKLKKTLALLCAFGLAYAAVAEATPQTKRIRCEKAQHELKLVEDRLSRVNPDYAGDLKREQALWEKQIRDNCRPSRPCYR
jgi:hypothetical protein